MAIKNLRTVKKAAAETGASISLLKRLMKSGRLTSYKINSATYISLVEFEKLAQPTKREEQNAKVASIQV